MKRVGLIVSVLILIVALTYLNNGISRNTRPDDDDAPPQKTQAQNPPPAKPPTRTLTNPPPPEERAGAATAPYKISVGWQFDAANQADSTALVQALGAVQQFAAIHKNTSVEIVNTDVPLEQRSPSARSVKSEGIAVNQRPLVGLTGNPGEGAVTPANITGALNAVVH